MMLFFVPARIYPTVTTTISPGFISPVALLCQSSIIFLARRKAGGASGRRVHMTILVARVRDRECATAIILGVNCARVGQPGLFLDSKRVELRAQHDRRAGAVLENRYNSGAADFFGD